MRFRKRILAGPGLAADLAAKSRHPRRRIGPKKFKRRSEKVRGFASGLHVCERSRRRSVAGTMTRYVTLASAQRSSVNPSGVLNAQL
jgi:hypothetical protein